MPKLDNKQIDGLQRLLSLLDPDSLTKEQYKGDIKKILDFLLKLKEKNRAEFENLNKRFSTQSEELTGNNTISISKLKDDFTELINKALKEQENGLNFIRDKVRKLTDGKDGRDADEKKMVKRVLAQIILPEQKEMILDTPEEMANKLEVLKDDNRLKISAIDKLREELDELKSRPIGGRGGARKVVYTKRINLSSQCNGTLKEFTMPKDCIDVLAVYGTQFPITFDEADFTFEGQTLTLTSEVGAPQTGQTLFALIQTLFYGKI